MQLTKLAAGAASVLGVLFVQSPALSQYDGKTIPGVACQRVSGGTYATFSGTVYNSSTTSELNLICPLVKTKTLSPGPDWYLYQAQAEVSDRNTTYNVTCKRTSQYISGSTIYTDVEQASTSGTSPNPQFLSSFGSDSVYYYDYVECSLPRAQNGNFSHLNGIAYLSIGE